MKRKVNAETAEHSLKRMKRSLNAKDETDYLRHCAEVLDYVRSYKANDGHLICSSFLRAPSRRTDPDYFKIVSQPIDLTRIQQKVKTEEYRSFAEFCSDIYLLVSNNKKYYKEGSDEYKDICEFSDIFEARRRDIIEEFVELNTGGGTPSSNWLTRNEADLLDDDREKDKDETAVGAAELEDIISSTLELTDETGRILCPPFRVLVPEEELPSYYARIKNPIDLKTIAQKIRSNEYRTWSDFDSDFRLMCKNAKVFNETGSMISRDASALLRNYKKRRAELCSQTSRCLTAKKIKQNAAAVDELLVMEPLDDTIEGLSEDSDEDEDTENNDDPKWRLYWAIRNEPNPSDPDTLLSEPFLALPSKSYYPDYYNEITSPMSLFIINKKLKRGIYESLAELLVDVTLVFENARSYNIEGSEIHDAAIKLEKLAISFARTMQPDSDKLLSTIICNDQSTKTPRQTRPRRRRIKAEPDSSSVPSPHDSEASSSTIRPSSSFSISTTHCVNIGDCVERSSGRGRKSTTELLCRYREKLRGLWETAYNFMDGTRRLADVFMVLPTKQDYPQYYDVIDKPIDLTMIKRKIDEDKYSSSEEFIEDVKLLFANARNFNEPGSQIYRDANTLESAIFSSYSALPEVPLINPLYVKSKYGSSPARFSSTLKRTVGSASDLKLSFPNSTLSRHGSNLTTSSSSNLQRVMINLFNLVKSARDAKGRNLAEAFLHLPSKLEYPDYYDVIKKPIDFARISSRISSNHYDSIDSLISDFTLMFDNACRYNEPESTIYKDALSLQKLVLQKKRELCKSATAVDVAFEIRSLLTSLLVSVANHQDRDGRCYSDSLTEVPALLKKHGVKPEDFPFSLDEIKKNIDRERYRRLDRFQDDLFALFDAARENSRSDSQLFEDSVELQMHYIKTRDNLTKDFLISPARHYTERTLLNAVTELRKVKLPEEKKVDEENAEKQTLGSIKEGDIDLESVGQGGLIYHVHDYAYVAPAVDESSNKNHIMRIERLFKNSDGETFARGFWCYRPEETFHLATKKFMENEVFFTTYFDTVTVDRLVGKCHVMSIRQYMKERPKGFDDEDVFVCESRYMGRQLHFKKIKHWPYKSEEDNVEFEKRPEALTTINRVASVFATKPPQVLSGEGQDADDEASQDSAYSSTDDERMRNLPNVLEKQRIEVVVPRQELQKDDDCRAPVFYEQLEHMGRWYQLGDFVLVYNPLKNRTVVLRIDKMWRTAEGDTMFSGPYFAQPREIDHEPTRMFYKRELFAVEQPDVTVPMNSIQERCVVLLLKDYMRLRPTEIQESKVYVVEYKVFGKEPAGSHCSLHGMAFSAAKKASEEAQEVINGLNPQDTDTVTKSDAMSEANSQKIKSLKSYHLSADVLEHEILLFKTPITMEKEMSPLLMKADTSAIPVEPIDDTDETASESLDGGEPAGKQELVSWLASQPKLNARSKSGYILFSAEIRKRIMHENPEAGFGEVSKIVGIEWKKLSEEQKKQYEVRAEYIATERAKQEAREPQQYRLQVPPGQIRVFMCKWQTCDFQFDTVDGLYEHIKTAHTSQIVDGENQYVCLWASCLKYRKEGKPFPSLPRLHRHIKEKHLNSSAKSIYPNQRSKNYYSCQQSSNTTPGTPSIPGTAYIAVQQATSNGQQQYTISSSPVTGYVAQAVMAPSNQVVTNGFVNGSAGTYVAAPAPAVLHSGGSVQAYHPYQQQIRQVTTVAQPLIGGNGSQYTAVTVQPVGYGTPSTSQQQPQPLQQSATLVPQAALIGDPGRSVVQASRLPEPVFVAPPNSVQVKRVLHSEAYLRYIESLHCGSQRTVSKWNKSMLASRRNTTTHKALPLNWLKEARENGVKEDELINALWRLRDHLMQDVANISPQIGSL